MDSISREVLFVYLFLILLEYGWFAVLYLFQQSESVTHIHISILLPNRGYHRTLSRPPCPIQQVLVNYLFIYCSMYVREILLHNVCIFSSSFYPLWKSVNGVVKTFVYKVIISYILKLFFIYCICFLFSLFFCLLWFSLSIYIFFGLL